MIMLGRSRATKLRLCAVGWLFVTLIGSAAFAAELSGPVRVIDGDTLDMDGVRIRLWGIDAPEMKQTCHGKDGQTYECGRDSAAVMRELTRDRTVECDERGHDRYRRVVAVCRTEAGEINAAIVRRGWAVDWPRYSHGQYQADEEAARAEGLGIWSGRFEMPWEWRREHQGTRH
jgi:endonuclease YncB( thermonuclease family)